MLCDSHGFISVSVTMAEHSFNGLHASTTLPVVDAERACEVFMNIIEWVDIVCAPYLYLNRSDNNFSSKLHHLVHKSLPVRGF